MKKLIAIIGALTIVLTACGGAGTQPTASSTPSTTSAKLSVVGSTSVGPLADKLKEAYKGVSDTAIEIQEVGSSAGIEATINGSADIGMSSRDLKPEELEKGCVPVVIAFDGIAVIVNNENTVQNLTTEQIQAIYKGEVKNWKEVGGKDAPITVVVRDSGSGTRDCFDELMKLLDKDKNSLIVKTAQVSASTGEVALSVAGDPNAIGYISLGSVDESIKVVSVNDITPTDETVKDKSYKISRSLYLLTKGEPSKEAAAFINFATSDEGQAVVKEMKFIQIK